MNLIWFNWFSSTWGKKQKKNTFKLFLNWIEKSIECFSKIFFSQKSIRLSVQSISEHTSYKGLRRVENYCKHGKHAWEIIIEGMRTQITIIAYVDIEKPRHPWKYLILTGSELVSLLMNHHMSIKPASLTQGGSFSNFVRQRHSLFEVVLFHY